MFPHAIAYGVHIDSPATASELAALHEAVELACPILNLLRAPQVIQGRVVQVPRETPAQAVVQ